MDKKHLKVREVAKILRKCPKTIYRWINEGKVFKEGEVIRVNNSILIPEEEIRRVLSDGKYIT